MPPRATRPARETPAVRRPPAGRPPEPRPAGAGSAPRVRATARRRASESRAAGGATPYRGRSPNPAACAGPSAGGPLVVARVSLPKRGGSRLRSGLPHCYASGRTPAAVAKHIARWAFTMNRDGLPTQIGGGPLRFWGGNPQARWVTLQRSAEGQAALAAGKRSRRNLGLVRQRSAAVAPRSTS